MLDDKELDKLCYGCIICAEVVDSGGNPVGPHFGIILDSNDRIAKLTTNPKYTAVCISHSDWLRSYRVNAPPELSGSVHCDWIVRVDEAGIQKIGRVLNAAEMIKIEEMIAKVKAKKKSTRN